MRASLEAELAGSNRCSIAAAAAADDDDVIDGRWQIGAPVSLGTLSEMKMVNLRSRSTG